MSDPLDLLDAPEVPRLPRQPGTLPTMLTLEAAAFELSVSLSTLGRMLKTGEIYGKKVGGRMKIPASEILECARVEPRPERPAPKPRPVKSEADAIRALR